MLRLQSQVGEFYFKKHYEQLKPIVLFVFLFVPEVNFSFYHLLRIFLAKND